MAERGTAGRMVRSGEPGPTCCRWTPRDVELDMHSDAFVTTFVDHHLSWTLGGPRESWEPERGTRLSERLVVVRPYDQRRRAFRGS